MKKLAALVLALFVVSSMSYASSKNEVLNVTDLVSVNNNEFKISPNGDGKLECIDFYVMLPQKKSKIKNWSFSIINKQSSEIAYNLIGKKEIPAIITWNGKNESGEVIEGTYGYVFTADINNKNIKIAQDGLIVDVTPPYMSIALQKDTFFADKEKNKFEKEMSIILNIGDENKLDLEKTNLCIVNSKNKTVKEWSFANEEKVPGVIYWNGMDDIYETVIPAGEYKIILTASDEFGNIASTFSTFTVFDTARGDSKIVVKEEPRGLLVNLSSNILFSSGKSVLKNDAAATLDETFDLLNAYPANKVLIEGYTDSTGTKKKNLKLSYDRAKAVYSYLVKKGIKAERLTAVGYGSKNPIASNKTAVGRAQNRRVNIIILKNMEQTESKIKSEISQAKQTKQQKEEKQIKEEKTVKSGKSAEAAKPAKVIKSVKPTQEKSEDVVEVLEILED